MQRVRVLYVIHDSACSLEGSTVFALSTLELSHLPSTRVPLKSTA